jgi:hypothetical protein
MAAVTPRQINAAAASHSGREVRCEMARDCWRSMGLAKERPTMPARRRRMAEGMRIGKRIPWGWKKRNGYWGVV